MRKRCSNCKKNKPITSFGKHQDEADGYRCWCKVCANKKARQYYQGVGAGKAHARYLVTKGEFVKAYGGRCYCCGETSVAFLTLDHIKGGGYKERAIVGRGTQMYLKAKREGYPRDKYRCACMNCNLATSQGRICPHQSN